MRALCGRFQFLSVPLLSAWVVAPIVTLSSNIASIIQAKRSESMRLSSHSLLHTVQPGFESGRLCRLDDL
jgi:hypothetical protein